MLRLTRAAVLRLLTLTALAPVLGCTRSTPTVLPEIGFTGRPPIELAVARIEVVQRYQPPGVPPHVEHQFLQVPSDVIRRWAEQRLRAVGSTGTATVVIEDAGVVEEQLPRTTGLRGAFTVDQSQRYRLTMAVRIEAANPANRTSGFASGHVERTVTVAEDISPPEREVTWYHLVETAAADLDTQLEASIRQHLGPLVVR